MIAVTLEIMASHRDMQKQEDKALFGRSRYYPHLMDEAAEAW